MKPSRLDRAHKGSYLNEAKRIFLEGSRFASPVDAVESGERTIAEWCDTLAMVRAKSGDTDLPMVHTEEQLLSASRAERGR